MFIFNWNWTIDDLCVKFLIIYAQLYQRDNKTSIFICAVVPYIKVYSLSPVIIIPTITSRIYLLHVSNIGRSDLKSPPSPLSLNYGYYEHQTRRWDNMLAVAESNEARYTLELPKKKEQTYSIVTSKSQYNFEYMSI